MLAPPGRKRKQTDDGGERALGAFLICEISLWFWG